MYGVLSTAFRLHACDLEEALLHLKSCAFTILYANLPLNIAFWVQGTQFPTIWSTTNRR